MVLYMNPKFPSCGFFLRKLYHMLIGYSQLEKILARNFWSFVYTRPTLYPFLSFWYISPLVYFICLLSICVYIYAFQTPILVTFFLLYKGKSLAKHNMLCRIYKRITAKFCICKGIYKTNYREIRAWLGNAEARPPAALSFPKNKSGNLASPPHPSSVVCRIACELVN